MEHRRREEGSISEWKAVERGWFLGEKAFKEELLARMHGRREAHYGQELREADLAHAEGLVREQMRKRGWTEADLSGRRKGIPTRWRWRSNCGRKRR